MRCTLASLRRALPIGAHNLEEERLYLDQTSDNLVQAGFTQVDFGAGCFVDAIGCKPSLNLRIHWLAQRTPCG